MKPSNQPITVFWFRRDLRFHDNHGLFEALKRSKHVLPVFIFDTDILSSLSDKKDKRVSFIHDSLIYLQIEILKHDSSLYIIHDTPENAFKTICNNFNVKEVLTNHDYEPYAIERDKKIAEWLSTKKIPFHSFKDQVLFEKSEVVKNDGAPYTIFTPYSKVWKQKLKEEGIPNYPSEEFLDNLVKLKPLPIPSLNEIGFQKSNTKVPSFRLNNNVIRNYHNTRNLPAENGTGKVSVHLRFGTVSVRKLVQSAVVLNEQWLNELIWREFFMMILFHFPSVVTDSFKKKYDAIEWRNNEAEFDAWCKGKTGYPIVDAGMRELNETGLMHNRVRMITASFLTKHLLIDWRWGEAYFAEKLLDYELSSNNGNWQWSAGCGCDAAPYFRIFNPAEQTKKFDPEYKYIKRWVPELNTNKYPKEIVDHPLARERVLRVFKEGINAFR